MKRKVYEVLYSEKSVVALAKLLAPKYRYCNWKWLSKIPEEKDIINCFKSLVHDVEDRIGTGGLYADRKKDGKIYIGVETSLSYKRLFPEDGEWEDWLKNLEKPERKWRMIRLR